MKLNLVGFVQGRLSRSPVNRLQYYPKKWDREFIIANKLGLNFIEFFSERKFNLKNLVWTRKGILNYKTKLIDEIHDQWCRDNGYPVPKPTSLQASRSSTHPSTQPSTHRVGGSGGSQ